MVNKLTSEGVMAISVGLWDVDPPPPPPHGRRHWECEKETLGKSNERAEPGFFCTEALRK